VERGHEESRPHRLPPA